MTKIFVLLAFLGIVRLSLAQTDVEFKQRVAASLPKGVSLISFDRLPSNRAIVVTTRKEDGDLEINATLIILKDGKVIQVSKSISDYCGLGKPRVVRLDLDRDGTPEIAIVCNHGGVHGLVMVSVVKATPYGLKDIVYGACLSYEWTIMPGGPGRPAELLAETSTYNYTGIGHGYESKPLRLRYLYKNGKFRLSMTRQLRKLDAEIEKAKANGTLSR